jgi:hypothetical protein
MLEITSDDIAVLDDEQLRAVVARLCEAELRGRGFSAKHVTWGGNQNAADGGIDVQIALPADAVIDGFIPRRMTGFQVKQQDMPPSEIAAEMRLNGAIRPSIQNLAAQSGAYIVVSSQGSTAEPALHSRIDAMHDAVASISNSNALALDFYDRTRLATWVRSHEGLIPWVRTLIGRPISGWKSYGAWAYDPGGEAAEYLLDGKLRVHPVKRETDQGLSAAEGIQQLRDELRQTRHVVRLVGLSGVGKTRLVQALFDERVGERSLDPALAIYTDIADEPNPQPTAMASNLVAAGTRAVLVIDNCPPELHYRLSEVCRQEGSNCNVMTIEYDIREDQPEGTEVFTLEPSSPDLVQKLIRLRFPTVSQVDAHTVAEFSGGNARIAIALAATIDRNDSVAGLTDEQLFRRLFQQRHGHDDDLYLVAQATSLVYSFQGEDTSEDVTAELVRIGRLIGKTAQEVYRGVEELRQRNLVQKQGVWRAVLPHAIANRLAGKALQTIPYAQIERHLMDRSSERLIRSFSRRLGYLNSSHEAVRIAGQWLGVGGQLENVIELSNLDRAVFENIAPVAPSDALCLLDRALERATPEKVRECEKYCDMLRSLAYDKALFERSTRLLIKIVTSSEISPQAHETKVFVSLFHLLLSGTHATADQRAAVVKDLLCSSEEKRCVLGVLALKAMLEASHFGAVGPFEFGARSRDFGYWPRTPEEARHWFTVSLRLAGRFAAGNGPASGQVRAALAEKFSGLWTRSNNHDEIVKVCEAIRNSQFWPEGWRAIRQTLDVHSRGLEEENLSKLMALEVALRPNDLAQKIRAVVFSTQWRGVDLDDFEDHSTDDLLARQERAEALAQDLGKAVATDDVLLGELLPEVVATKGRLRSFGQGLAAGATDARGLWQRLVDALAATESGVRGPQVFQGFLRQLRKNDAALAAALLDEAVDDRTLGELYPSLQVSVDLDARDVARLKHSIRLGNAAATAYSWLAGGRATDPISPPDLKELILAIASMPSGFGVAVDVLQARLHSDRSRNEEAAPEVIATGSTLMQQLTFTHANDLEEYAVGEIARSCLKGATGGAVVTELCRRLRNAVGTYATSIIYHDDLLSGLMFAQPTAGLDGLCGGDQTELDLGTRILRDIGERKRPLAAVQDNDLLDWCEQEASSRYTAMASVVTISEREAGSNSPRWTGIALRFLEEAPEPTAVLRVFTSRIMMAGGWTGSNATIVEADATLLDQLGAYENLNAAVAEQKERLNQWTAEERRREYTFDRDRDERFE